MPPLELRAGRPGRQTKMRPNRIWRRAYYSLNRGASCKTLADAIAFWLARTRDKSIDSQLAIHGCACWARPGNRAQFGDFRASFAAGREGRLSAPRCGAAEGG